MAEECPQSRLCVKRGRNSKSPTQVTVSSPDSDGMKSPSGRMSPDSRCAICLGKFLKKSFTDSCLHQFCFQCLLQWSKVKPECPLCKQPFKSIIHNVRSNSDYDQYRVERREPAYVVSEILHSYDFDLVLPIERSFRYSSTMTGEYFRELAESFLTSTRSSYQVQSFVPTPIYHIPSASRYSPVPERRSGIQDTDFRRNIYVQNLWVQDLVDVNGRYRECSPQFYRENPAQIHRIIPWLNREIKSLVGNNETNTTCILNRIVSLLPEYSIRSRQFHNAVKQYFGARTEHFIHEFYTFARSVYDITGFDQNAVYVRQSNYSHEVQDIFSSSSSSVDDSDVEIIGSLNHKSEVKPRKRLRKSTRNRTDYSTEPVPGPSGINNRRSETIEVCESDADDVKIIDYTKPEPEVVTLSSGDESYSEAVDVKNKKLVDKNDKKRKSLRDKGKRKPYGRESSSSTEGNYFWGDNSSNSSTSRSSSTSDAGSSSSRSSSLVVDSYSNDYGPSAKFKKRKSSKGHKKCKKSDEKKMKQKSSKKRKSKVKSCVIVPCLSEKHPTYYSRVNEPSSYTRKRDRSISSTDEDTMSSLPSYWSLAFSEKEDKNKKKKRVRD